MFHLSKEMEDRISALGKELQSLIPDSSIRIWEGQENEYVVPSTGEVRNSKNAFINIEIPDELGERISKALEFLRETNAENPELQCFIQAEIMDVKFNTIACYISKVTERWEVQLARAYESKSFLGTDSAAFQSKFEAEFAQRSTAEAIDQPDF